MLAMTYSRMQKPHTTIGAGGLNCRVRDGTGCDPTAPITNTPHDLSLDTLKTD